MSVTVIATGLLTSIQDAGRQVDAVAAIAPSGAMDQYALRAANLLVGNLETSALLEATYTGPVLEFNSNALVAVTGARTVPLVDEVEQSLYTAFEIKAGQRLSFAYAKAGARIYIAVAGGFNVALLFDSRSSLEYRNQNQLKVGTRLPIGQELAAKVYHNQTLPPKFHTNTLAAKIGIDSSAFAQSLTTALQQDLFNTEWVIDARSNRVGCYFKSDQVKLKTSFAANNTNLIAEEAIRTQYPQCPLGLVQLLNPTELAIWQRDAVAYDSKRVIGVVLAADLNLLAQLAPGNVVRFGDLTADDVLKEQRYYQAKLQQLREYYHEFLYIKGPSQAELVQQWQDIVAQHRLSQASANQTTAPESRLMEVKPATLSSKEEPDVAVSLQPPQAQNLVTEVICLQTANQYPEQSHTANAIVQLQLQLKQLADKVSRLEQSNRRLYTTEFEQLEEISELKQMLLYTQGYSIKTDAKLALAEEALITIEKKLQQSELELAEMQQSLSPLKAALLKAATTAQETGLVEAKTRVKAAPRAEDPPE